MGGTVPHSAGKVSACANLKGRAFYCDLLSGGAGVI